MKDIAVVYATKYGHTKQYAEWMKEEVGADIFVSTSFTPTKALEYKAVVFAGGVYGDKILIMDWLKKNLGQVNVNKMVIAAVSWYCSDSEDAKARLIAENYPEQFKNVVPLIVLNSGIDKKKTSVMDKAQLLAAQSAINKHEVRTADDINALAIIKGYSDSTSKDNLKSLIAAVQDILNPSKKSAQRAAEEIRAALNEKPAPAAEKPAPAQQTVPTPPTPKAEPPKTVQPRPAAPKGDHVVTSLDDALAALSSGNMLLNKPPVHQPKAVEVEEEQPAASVSEKTAEETPVQTEPKSEEPKEEITAPVQSEPEPEPKHDSKPAQMTQDGEPIVASLDDALAALSSGNMLFNKPHVHEPKSETPVHSVPVEEEPKAETPIQSEPIKEEPKAETPIKSEPVKEEPKVETPIHSVPVEEEPKTETPIHSEPVEEEPKSETLIQSEPVKEEPKAETPIQSKPVKEEPKAETPIQSEPVKEEPKFKTPIFTKPAKTEEIPENDNVLSLDDFNDLDNITVPQPKQIHIPAPAPAPAPKAAPKSNSYMDLFSRKKPAEKPSEPVQNTAPAPAPAAAPISDFMFDPLAAEPTPAPAPAPTPKPAPVSNAGIDFDFDILGNESSTANRTSSRALNAVEDLAKAKAKAEADRLKNEKEREIQAARDAAAASADNSYDIINNSIDLDITDDGAKKPTESASFSAGTEKRDIGNISMDEDEDIEVESEETNESTVDATFGDDVMFVDDYDDSELDGLTAADLLAPEQPVQKNDHKRVDFKKLQQEIEESIALNRQIRDKERTRNMRESERKALEEAEKTPKKGIKQPEDADIFFKRPGKDYYSSDSMPEIKFNRHGNGF